MTLTAGDWIGAAVIVVLLVALAADAIATLRGRRAGWALIDGGHDVEYAPATGGLVHFTTCWCHRRDVPAPVPVPHPMDAEHPPADYED